MVNKYDGIDLPDNACRIIVLDGVPDARTSVERMKENYLQGSMDAIRNKIQKIEQGMGRGVRSNNDYCGVIIMGAPLIQQLNNCQVLHTQHDHHVRLNNFSKLTTQPWFYHFQYSF